MKISVNIETSEPADLIRIGNALAGVMADPTAGAAQKPKTTRTSKTEAPASSATPAQSAAQSSPAAGEAVSSAAQQAAGTGSATDVAISEADLTAAANAASAKLGASGPGKIKEWIAQNFQKSDGSAGTLRLTREDQRPALLKGLQEIGQGVKVI